MTSRGGVRIVFALLVTAQMPAAAAAERGQSQESIQVPLLGGRCPSTSSFICFPLMSTGSRVKKGMSRTQIGSLIWDNGVASCALICCATMLAPPLDFNIKDSFKNLILGLAFASAIKMPRGMLASCVQVPGFQSQLCFCICLFLLTCTLRNRR